jgi:hypothetical protein
MKSEAVQLAVDLGAKLRLVFVATADAKGSPHIAAAGSISPASKGRVAVDAWFCPGTVANLEQNHHIALVVWDAIGDEGYQLLGEVEEMVEQSIMNGYVPGMEDSTAPPQVERRLLVRVEKVVRFSQAPHSDVEVEIGDTAAERIS